MTGIDEPGTTILIVDDNRNNLFSLRTLLGRLPDCRVVEATSGEEALGILIEDGVDLVLLDIQMPGMDGFETARHMRMAEKTRQIPVIFITAVFRAEEFIRQGYEVGAVDYLTKPVDDNLLLNRVRLYLQLFQRERRLRAALADLHHKEQALQQLNRELEYRITERTFELERNNRQLETEMAQRQRVQQALAASEHKLRLLFERMTSGWLLLQEEGGGFRMVEGNPAFLALSGNAGKGRDLVAVMPELVVHHRRELVQVARAGGSFTCEERFAGLERHCLVVVYGVGEGRLGVILTDITRRKEMEAALHQARDEAERATRTKGEFLAAMSHEIRTPMNVVVGMGDVLLETGLSDEQRGYVERLQAAGTNLLELINQILDYSKIEAGKLELRPEPVAVAPLVEGVAELLRGMAEGKGLRLGVAVDGGVPPWVLGDGLRLRQVLVNLLGNAIKFTDRGRVAIRVGVEGEGERLRFQVEDTGVGIGPEHLESIFEEFTQVDGGITRRFGGTGLGLTLSRQLVELMGGEIGVASQPGVGSTFHFTLPLVAIAAPGAPPVTPVPVSDEVPWTPLRILLVEDSADNQLLVRTFLRNTPHRLTLAGDGEEAVRRTGEEHFDLVFMDVQMPIMDGYTATRAIRQREVGGGRRLPIVALTAHALEGEAQRSREAGCDLYLAKPIKKQRLLEVIRQIGQGVLPGK